MTSVINIIVLADWETVISPLVHEVRLFSAFWPIRKILISLFGLEEDYYQSIIGSLSQIRHTFVRKWFNERVLDLSAINIKAQQA